MHVCLWAAGALVPQVHGVWADELAFGFSLRIDCFGKVAAAFGGGTFSTRRKCSFAKTIALELRVMLSISIGRPRRIYINI